MTDERIYLGGNIALLVVELILSIPLVSDPMVVGRGTELILTALILHTLLALYASVWRLHASSQHIHVIGWVAFLMSFVPIVAFIPHVLVSYFIIKFIRNWFNGSLFE